MWPFSNTCATVFKCRTYAYAWFLKTFQYFGSNKSKSMNYDINIRSWQPQINSIKTRQILNYHMTWSDKPKTTKIPFMSLHTEIIIYDLWLIPLTAASVFIK